jgi:hypothetical protein
VCRMDLPGPTTSVGTGTDYSVGTGIHYLGGIHLFRCNLALGDWRLSSGVPEEMSLPSCLGTHFMSTPEDAPRL